MNCCADPYLVEHGDGSADCGSCGSEYQTEIPNPYEDDRYISYCPDCGKNTEWIRLVEETHTQCDSCGLYEDQAEERIKQGK